MGEMADFFIHQDMDAHPTWGSPIPYRRKVILKCKHCGSTEVKWEKTSYGYTVLNKDGTKHNCVGSLIAAHKKKHG